MTTELNKQSVLLFTGGGKGITAQCAIALSTQLSCTYVLMGRSQMKSEPVWAVGVDDDAALKQKIVANAQAESKNIRPKEIETVFRQIKGSREIRATLHQIHENGAKAFYIHADVTNLQEVRQALANAQSESGSITGLVHGAGRLADKRIERKTEADYDAVYGTKVSGLKTVLSCLDVHKLELMVLFSSVAGAFGNVGQADYAMANEALNKFALRFQKENPGCHTLAINWGPWDSGMVTPALKNAFAEMGITLISNPEGTQQFVDEVLNLRQPSAQLVFGCAIQRPVEIKFGDEASEVRRVLSPDDNPFLLDHQIGPNRVLPATCAAGWMADTCEMLFPSTHFFRLENYRVFKGVVFSDSAPQTFITRVKAASGDESGEIQAHVQVVSVDNDREVLHYRADIILRNKRPVSPERINVSAWKNMVPVEDGQHYYDEKLLFHGPAFRGLKAVLTLSKDSLVTVCHLPAVPVFVQGQFQVGASNPYLNDVILQGLLAWSYRNYGAVCLPAGIQHLEQFSPLPFDVDVFVAVEILSQSTTLVRAKAAAYDSTGRLLLQCTGIEGTMSKALLPLFKTSATSLG